MKTLAAGNAASSCWVCQGKGGRTRCRGACKLQSEPGLSRQVGSEEQRPPGEGGRSASGAELSLREPSIFHVGANVPLLGARASEDKWASSVWDFWAQTGQSFLI